MDVMRENAYFETANGYGTRILKAFFNHGWDRIERGPPLSDFGATSA
jgi:hypothetical protein